MFNTFSKAHLQYSYPKLTDNERLYKGESSTTIVSSPAPQPSTADAINAWVSSMPTVYETQMKYAPQQAAQTAALTSQYALPIAQALYSAQSSLYPKTSGLQETLAGQAAQGATATSMPDWMQRQYKSQFNANLGTNAGSPIGADYVSRNMQNQLYQQQQYYQNMGLSLAGRQPLTTASTPLTNNYSSTFTPSSVMDYLGGLYGTNASANRTSNTTNSGGGLFGGLFG